MNKQYAIKRLGGTVKATATEIGITEEAVRAWPDPLPRRISDRIEAALWRRHVASENNQATTQVQGPSHVS